MEKFTWKIYISTRHRHECAQFRLTISKVGVDVNAQYRRIRWCLAGWAHGNWLLVIPRLIPIGTQHPLATRAMKTENLP
jgi:hypothetical protein